MSRPGLQPCPQSSRGDTGKPSLSWKGTGKIITRISLTQDTVKHVEPARTFRNHPAPLNQTLTQSCRWQTKGVQERQTGGSPALGMAPGMRMAGTLPRPGDPSLPGPHPPGQGCFSGRLCPPKPVGVCSGKGPRTRRAGGQDWDPTGPFPALSARLHTAGWPWTEC